MTTIEEKAKAYTDKVAPLSAYSSGLVLRAYIAGGTEALAGQWRSVEDELPEMLTRVLVCIKEAYGFPHIHICKRIYHDATNPKDEKWHWSNVAKDSDVVAWMPLPEPPKTNTDNANK